MNWKKILAFVAGILASFDANSKEPLELSAEDKQALDSAAKVEGFAEKFVATFNEKNQAEKDNKLSAELITEFMASEETPEGEAGEGPEAGEESTLGEKVRGLIQRVDASEKANKELIAQLEAMEKNPELDQPEAKGKLGKQHVEMKHTKTHVLGLNEDFATAESRPWNKAVLELSQGNEVSAATDWNKLNIERINEDFGAYARKNLPKVLSLFRDGLDIPKHWKIISGVSDKIAYAMIVTGEITQTIKNKWLPKNNQEFHPIEGKVFDIQIDIEWSAAQLKSIEKSWLNTMFGDGSSSPYKMQFVEFLMEKLRQQARKEDKIALVNGVFHDNKNGDTPGLFINKMDGLLKLIVNNKNVTYKPFDLGEPTKENIFDYITSMVEKLPYDFRIQPGLYLNISKAWEKAYNARRAQLQGGNTDYKGDIDHVDGYPNIKFQTLAQLEGRNFFFITPEDNINILIDKPGEESVFTIEKSKRTITAFADYKIGPHVNAFGVKPENGAPTDFNNQIFFSNDVEVLTDIYVPVAANATELSVNKHNALAVGEFNTSDTDVTSITNTTEGQNIYLFGNTDTNKSTIKNNANIILDDGADVTLNKGDLLVLKALAGGKVIELYRKLAGATEPVVAFELAADATTADAVNGKVFETQENTGATVITNIVNAVDGETYTIKGGSSTNATTIANSGNFRLTAAMTLNDGTFIKVLYVGGKFVETARG